MDERVEPLSIRQALTGRWAQQLQATLQGRGAIFSVGPIRPEISGSLEGSDHDSTADLQRTGDLNDLWEYTVSNNEWTWKNGPNVGDQNGTFGTLGQLAPGNIPENREGAPAGRMLLEISGFLAGAELTLITTCGCISPEDAPNVFANSVSISWAPRIEAPLQLRFRRDEKPHLTTLLRISTRAHYRVFFRSSHPGPQ